MGYNSTTSTAIRVSSDLYDRCAERTDVERDFWYKGEFQQDLIDSQGQGVWLY